MVTQVQRIQLDVVGITCRMCPAHIARKLNKIDGVRASVDFPTKIATIDVDRGVSTVSADALCEIVQQAGYHATPRSERPLIGEGSAIPGGLLQRSAVATVRFLRQLGGMHDSRSRR